MEACCLAAVLTNAEPCWIASGTADTSFVEPSAMCGLAAVKAAENRWPRDSCTLDIYLVMSEE